MNISDLKKTRLARRVHRTRKRIFGTPERPRMAVSRSNTNILVQIIDDLSGRTLCSASTLAKNLPGDVSYGGNVKAAVAVGKAIGEKAKAAGITAVCFDRRGQRFHGRIKALADAAREAGLKF